MGSRLNNVDLAVWGWAALGDNFLSVLSRVRRVCRILYTVLQIGDWANVNTDHNILILNSALKLFIAVVGAEVALLQLKADCSSWNG